MGGLDDGGMIGQAEVVVGAEVDDLAAADADGRALRPLELPFASCRARGSQVVELRPQHVAEFVVAHGESSLLRYLIGQSSGR